MFKPTYLYIKQHSITGKLYLGKTTKQNLIKYTGSGKYWLRHIKVHGKEHITTIWYCLFNEETECVEFALMLSELYDVVNSDEWLNFIPENGINGGGALGYKQSIEHKKKSKDRMIGNSYATGIVHSSIEKELKSIRQLGTTKSENMREKSRKPKSEEHKLNMRKPKSPEHIANMKIAKANQPKFKWITDGVISKKLIDGNSILNGFYFGRAPW